MISRQPYRDPHIGAALLKKMAERLGDRPQTITLMEVCGTHTMAIYRAGIRALLPPQVRLISGPGCPVCVTPIEDIDRAIALTRRPDTLIATFGDMMRVPGSHSSLQREKATGANVRIVYSPLDALKLAKNHPDKTVIFLGIGFETTAPAVAGSLLEARRQGVKNYQVLCSHKTMPAPMAELASDPDLAIDGFLCPAHVSAIIGAEAFRPLCEDHALPCAVTGFEPLDILQGIDMLLDQVMTEQARIDNQYRRVVKPEGNRRARHILYQVFEPDLAVWRGLGPITNSGLRIREDFAEHDAVRQIPLQTAPAPEPTDCRCGDILKGKTAPQHCPQFGASCTPETPIGACMVSAEGSCAAAYKYDQKGIT
ncbi:MAG: hydrogenase formation protein HypD [Desulfuromonas sp.]|nr:MAG: hydrogenase formation protein HypD [Desulfuromonas sp.]